MEIERLKPIVLSFFKLRTLQVGRILNDVGLIRIALILVFCLHFIILIPQFFFNTPWWAAFFIMLAIGSLHYNRGDRPFLAHHFSPYTRRIMLAEYQALALPATALLLYANQLLCALVFVIALSLVPYSNISIRKSRGKVRPIYFISSTAFELKAGLRDYYIIISILVLLGAAFSKFIYVPLLAIFLLALILASFNNTCESGLMVEAFRRSPSIFLNQKLLTQLVFMLIVFLPVNFSFILFHSAYWYVLVAVNGLCLIILALSICLKYAMYIPGETLKRNNLLLGLAIACFFIVFLAPVPLVLLIVYYRKASKNLNVYCYA